jgi:hypothetical protein
LGSVNKSLNNTLNEVTLWNRLLQRDFGTKSTSEHQWMTVFQLPPTYATTMLSIKITSCPVQPIHFAFKKLQIDSSAEPAVYCIGIWRSAKDAATATSHFELSEGKEFL